MNCKLNNVFVKHYESQRLIPLNHEMFDKLPLILQAHKLVDMSADEIAGVRRDAV